MKEHTLWTERYRSKTVNDYVGNEHIKSLINTSIEKNNSEVGS